MQTGGGGPDPAVMAAIERGNAVVFLDVALGEGESSSNLGRIKLELFVKDVCKTVVSSFMRDFCSKLDFGSQELFSHSIVPNATWCF